MVRVVGVRFKIAGKVYYFDPGELPITAADKVVVETVRGVEYGEVVVGPKEVEDDQVVQPLKKVIRIGTERDAAIAAENKRKEKDAFGIALKKIAAHGLDMHLVDVEYTFDGSKNIFYFTSEGRVDFRELVRDLAGVFRTRIEMRQIGVRDEAKLLGGIGPCGRVLCCTSFLGDFAPVSIRMAKDQNLSLNPSKISGLCGRLMCCLRYEQDTYEAAKKDPTLAPGYIPPVVAVPSEEVPAVAELEDRPSPVIGVRNRTDSGMSARIAQATAPTERPARRRPDRPAGGEHPGPRQSGDRPGGGQPPAQSGGGRQRTEGRPQGGGRQQQGGTRPAPPPQQGKAHPHRGKGPQQPQNSAPPQRSDEREVAPENAAGERSQGEARRRRRRRPKGDRPQPPSNQPS